MLNYIILLICLISGFALSVTPAASQSEQPASTQINVKDYGAIGNGITDDTSAIREAMKAAAGKIFAKPTTGKPYGSACLQGPVVVFPSGEYLISDEVEIAANEIRGEGRAVIKQNNIDKNLLTSKYAWQVKISGLSFIGGKNQLDLYNPNQDEGQIIIDNCRFYSAAGYGINTNVLSTTVRITDCEFLKCMQAWRNKACDQAVMRDCWITTSTEMIDKAAIEHIAGRLTIENLVGVPLVNGTKQRWIDNKGYWLTLKQCRFGGEGGGITPVYNYSRYWRTDDPWFHKPSDPQGYSVILDDCEISCVGTKDAEAAIYCYGVPNIIRIRDCIFHNGKAIILDKGLDTSKYFFNTSRDLLSYSVEGCSGSEAVTIPEVLRTFNVGIVPKKVLSESQTIDALKNAKQQISSEKYEMVKDATWKGHVQKINLDSYINLIGEKGFLRGANELLTDRAVISKIEQGAVIVFREESFFGHEPIRITAQVDLDKYPWLTWRQRRGSSPGSFWLQVEDKDSGTRRMLYPETHSSVYDYHADNLKVLFGGGLRNLDITWCPLGWGMKSAVVEDWFWAQPGQYVVMEFMRMESD